jgi:hypothetical protein
MESDKNFADGLGLIPVSIIAFGPSAAPIERLVGLQSAIARAIGWLANSRLPNIRLPRASALRLNPTSQGDL